MKNIKAILYTGLVSVAVLAGGLGFAFLHKPVKQGITINGNGQVGSDTYGPSGAVSLQPNTPGIQQIGNANISGTIRAGYFIGDGSGLTGVAATSSVAATNDWGTFLSSYGVSALTTSSTYPVWIRGDEAVSGTLAVASNLSTGGTLTQLGSTYSVSFTPTSTQTESTPYFWPLDKGLPGQMLTNVDGQQLRWKNSDIQGLVTFFDTNWTSDIGGAKVEWNTQSTSTSANLTSAAITVGNTLLNTFITPTSSPNLTNIPAGQWKYHVHANKSGTTRDVRLYMEVYKRASTNGTETILMTSDNGNVLTTDSQEYDLTATTSTITLAATDRLEVKLYANIASGGSGSPTVTQAVMGSTQGGLTIPVLFQPGFGLPGGSDTQVQFNDGGIFGGNSGLVFNKTTGAFGVGTSTPLSQFVVVGANSLLNNAFKVASSTDGSSLLSVKNINGDVSMGPSDGFLYEASSSIAYIGGLQTGAMNFPDDAGLVSWIDLNAVAAAAGTPQGYTANLMGQPMINVFGVPNASFVLDTTNSFGVNIATSTTSTAMMMIDGYGKAIGLSVFNGGLKVGGDRTNALGQFYVDTSGNITASGTLQSASTASSTFKGGLEAARFWSSGSGIGYPDYILDKNYKLQSLDDLISYLNDKHHLPDVAGVEAAKQGIDLLEFSKQILTSLEKLYLYVIQIADNTKHSVQMLFAWNSDQDRKIDELQKQVKELQNKIKEYEY